MLLNRIGLTGGVVRPASMASAQRKPDVLLRREGNRWTAAQREPEDHFKEFRETAEKAGLAGLAWRLLSPMERLMRKVQSPWDSPAWDDYEEPLQERFERPSQPSSTAILSKPKRRRPLWWITRPMEKG